MLYVMGKDFKGFELEALWEDGRFGFSHWHNFQRIAVVQQDHRDGQRVDQHVQAVFSLRGPAVQSAELPAAKDWIARTAGQPDNRRP